MRSIQVMGLVAAALIAGACAREGSAGGAEGATVAPTAGTAQGPAVQGSGTPAAQAPAGAPIAMKVYKDPNCGCCNEWVKHVEANGFKVESFDMPDVSAVKTRYGVGNNLRSCHTAVVGDYAIEGHVPADLIHRLLSEKPAVAGLAVPGMPMGSPGMEGAYKERYDVLTFDRSGKTTVYATR